MNTNSVITILSSLGQFGGLSIFLFYVYKGLKTEISNLNVTVEAQKKTLEAQKQTLETMEMRIRETEKFRDLSRQFLNDLPEDIDKYKNTLSRLKDEVIKELEDANARKDEKLKKLTETKLAEIDAQEKLLEELPKMREKLIQTHDSLESRLGVLDMFQPWNPLGRLLKDFEQKAKEQFRRDPLLLSGDNTNKGIK